MYDLKIKIEKQLIGEKDFYSVKGRNLWRELGIKSQYSQWIKRNLEMFDENRDYIKIKNSAGRGRLAYSLTIDTAKHIALSSRTEKGKEIRQYFIEMENQLGKNGYIISNSISEEQEAKLVDEVIYKYDRRVIDHMRVKVIEEITTYLQRNDAYTLQQVNSLLSSIHQHCHVASMQKTAASIILEQVEKGLNPLSLVTTNQMRKGKKVRKIDYKSAINYYSKKYLNTWGDYFDMITKRALAHIHNRWEVCDPKTVKECMEKEAKRVVIEYSGLKKGTKVPGISRKGLNELVSHLYDNGFHIPEKDKEECLKALAKKRSRSYIV